MSREKILVVEDDEDIAELIRYTLVRENFRPVVCGSGEEAVRKLQNEPFNIMLLDIMLPGIDGIDICKKVKSDERYSSIPVIMITARGEESDVVTGLEIGADDYIIKPFSPRVLVARIRSALRRRHAEKTIEGEPVEAGDFMIHPGKREVLVKGVPVELTNLEFLVLQFLAKKPGWVFSRYQIVEGVRGDNYPVTDRSVDVCIVGLRKKLGDHGDRIETVRGAGYRFREE
jgi:two-component system phosphate regulon response regulator PhoB